MTETQENDYLSIGEASEIINLPESTIRYYDNEFTDYLSIPRGENNQRLFDEEHLEDLEYIRYLIKREELSVEKVRERLDREKKYKDESGSSDRMTDEKEKEASSVKQSGDTPRETEGDEQSPKPDSVSSDRPDRSVSSDDNDLLSSLQKLDKRIRQMEEKLDQIQETQNKLKDLLDLNLQRYNQLVEDM